MIVDFHTHVFPEAIAARTIETLAEKAGIRAYTDGTLSGLKASMRESGIGWSVILPVVTKPKQFQSVNDYAASINGKAGILSFGGIHPNTADYQGELDTIKALGLKGIKIHPDYQGVPISDPRYLRIIRYAVSIGLFVVTHAGVDVGMPERVLCPPQLGAAMLEQVYGGKAPEQPRIIFAHTGGWRQWDDVERYLVGKPVYLDISFSLGMISDEQMMRIIRRHGAQRILFATDSPWSSQRETLEAFRRLPLTETERELILWENAYRILKL